MSADFALKAFEQKLTEFICCDFYSLVTLDSWLDVLWSHAHALKTLGYIPSGFDIAHKCLLSLLERQHELERTLPNTQLKTITRVKAHLTFGRVLDCIRCWTSFFKQEHHSEANQRRAQLFLAWQTGTIELFPIKL